jgi:PAS domain S-box-containing protein
MENLEKLNKSELITLLKQSQNALKNDEKEEKHLLHDLQTHQIELELQNRDLREMQAELERARDLYADLYDFAPVGYMTLDNQGLISSANLTTSLMLGVDRQNLIGRPLGSYIAEHSKAAFFQHLKEVAREENKNFFLEVEMKKKEGEIKYMRLESQSRYPYNDQCECRTVMIDITEKKELEKKEQLLLQQTRFAEMGEMVGASIAHQWRQPLNVLAVILQDLEDTYEAHELDNNYMNKSISQAMEQITYMSETISEFRQYFKPGKEYVEFDVGEALKSALKMVSGQFKNDRIELAVEGEGFLVKGPESELKHVIINILHNAREAIQENRKKNTDLSGKVTIRLDSKKRLMEFCDNGGGIDKKVLNYIFKPYVTTKGEVKGTGIGLFIAQTIIDQKMKGHVSARNEGDGAVISIEF